MSAVFCGIVDAQIDTATTQTACRETWAVQVFEHVWQDARGQTLQWTGEQACSTAEDARKLARHLATEERRPVRVIRRVVTETIEPLLLIEPVVECRVTDFSPANSDAERERHIAVLQRKANTPGVWHGTLDRARIGAWRAAGVQNPRFYNPLVAHEITPDDCSGVTAADLLALHIRHFGPAAAACVVAALAVKEGTRD